MRLQRLEIIALPGIQPGFELGPLDPGLQLITGPNASGKSSILRAFRALIAPSRETDHAIHIAADLETVRGPMRAVRLGRDTRWYRRGEEVEPPPLPPAHLLDCYTLGVESLTAAGETEATIGRHLALELAGGYDLSALVEGSGPFRVKRNHGQDEARAHAEAIRLWRQRREEHEQLLTDEQRLSQLEADYAEAEQARRHADALRRAAELGEVRAARQETEERLAEFPAGMDRLRGDEGDRLDEFDNQLQSIDDERARIEEAREQSNQELVETGLGKAAPAPESLHQQRRLLERLHEAQRAAGEHRREREAARQRQAAAAEELGTEAAERVQADPQALRAAEEALESYRQRNAELRAVEAELARLPGATTPAPPSAETVRAARRALVLWLSAPPRPRLGLVRGSLALLGTLSPAGIAGGGAVLIDPGLTPAWAWISGGATASLLLLGVGMNWLRAPASEALREQALSRYPNSVRPPTAWDHTAVGSRLEELDRLLEHAEHNERRTRLRQERERLQQACREITTALQPRLSRLGIEPTQIDAATVRFLQRLRDWDRAREELLEAESWIAHLEGEAKRLSEQLVAFLEGWGVAVAETDRDDRNALLTAIERLERLSEQHREADRRSTELDERLRTLERQRQAVSTQRHRLFTEAGFEAEDRTSLQQRLDRLARWRSLRDEYADQRRHENTLREQLESTAPELISRAEGEPPSQLRAEAEDHDHQGSLAHGISQEIGSIQERIRQVKREHPLEQARAERQRTRDALEERRNEALLASAGIWLVDEIRAEHTSQQQPQALRQADTWLARFTQHRYRLQLRTERNGDGYFVAYDTQAQEDRPLSALSTGTRMQLLLATRIAFAREAERGGEPLPLFLDEALTTADLERFAAVADALETLAADDQRQIFYLSARGAEEALWRQRCSAPPRIDLAELRGTAAAAPAPEHLQLPDRPTLPDPIQHSAREFAQALHVPAIDPWRGLGPLHLFHLVRDDLPRLYRLLAAGIERVGPLQDLLDSNAATALLGQDERHDLHNRIAIAEAWLHAWTRGRGRPVPAAEVTAAPCLANSKHRDAVGALARECSGDAEALLEALRNRAISGFRQNKIDELRHWLEEHGYLDRRPASTQDDRLRRALDAASGPLQSGAMEPATVRRLVDHLEAGCAAAQVLSESEETS